MNKYELKYKKIVDGLIEKSFPNLKGKKIFISDIKFQVRNASATVTYFGFCAWVVVWPASRKYSEKVLRGLFAHELSHYEVILNMDFLEKIKFAFRWLFTKKGKAWFETTADKYAIKKGYAREQHELAKIVEKGKSKEKLKKRHENGYLSSKEIKSYAKSIGKWH